MVTDGQYKLQTNSPVTITAPSHRGDAGECVVNISEPFIRRPVATTLLMAALAFVGIVSFPFLPVAPLPQVDFPTIQITTTWTGASAETMATSVAAPLEQQFGQIAGITQMTSQSSLGASTIVIQFDLERNIDSAAQDVQAAITVAGKTTAAGADDAADLQEGQSGGRADPAAFGAFRHRAADHRRRIRQRLSRAADLAGERRRAGLGVRRPHAVDPRPGRSRQARRRAASRSRTSAARWSSSTTNAAKGVINTDKITFTIAANDQITDADKFNDVVLAYRNGAPIRVRDVGQAVVRAGRPHRRRLSEQPATASSSRYSSSPAPTSSRPSTRSRRQLPQLTARIPPAVKVETILDRTVTIRASVIDVEFTLMLTICLVVLVILLFLRNFWATLIPSVTVPLALAGSFAAMYLMHFSLDNLSLMALTIAVGFVVDDAIVVVENIYRHVEHGEPPFRRRSKARARSASPCCRSPAR